MATNVIELQFEAANFDVTDLGGGVVRITFTGGAPTNAEYIVGAVHAGLSVERLVIDTATITWDLATPGQAKANGTVTQYTNEMAQDAVGTIFVDSSTIDFTYNDAAPSITAIVIDGSISFAKIVDSAAGFSIVGKSTTGAGDFAEITAAADQILGRSGAGNLVFGTLITNQVGEDQITFAKMQNLTSDRLMGRDTAASGDPEEITVTGGIEWSGVGGIQTSAFTGDVTKAIGGTALTIANDAVTYAKMQNVSATSRILGRITAGAGDPEELTPTQVRTVANVNWSKSITVETPTAAEDLSMFHSDEAITITKMVAVLTGSASPSVTWTVRQGTDRSAAGTEVVTGGTVTTSVTTGSVVASFNDATVPLNSFLWLETTAQSGTVDTFNLTIFYTKD